MTSTSNISIQVTRSNTLINLIFTFWVIFPPFGVQQMEWRKILQTCFFMYIN